MKRLLCVFLVIACSSSKPKDSPKAGDAGRKEATETFDISYAHWAAGSETNKTVVHVSSSGAVEVRRGGKVVAESKLSPAALAELTEIIADPGIDAPFPGRAGTLKVTGYVTLDLSWGYEPPEEARYLVAHLFAMGTDLAPEHVIVEVTRNDTTVYAQSRTGRVGGDSPDQWMAKLSPEELEPLVALVAKVGKPVQGHGTSAIVEISGDVDKIILVDGVPPANVQAVIDEVDRLVALAH